MAIPAADVAPIMITTVLAAAVAGVIVLRGPVGRALAWRIESGLAPDRDVVERITGRDQRVAELEEGQQRIDELESRLEFAERVVARPTGGAPLGADDA